MSELPIMPSCEKKAANNCGVIKKYNLPMNKYFRLFSNCKIVRGDNGNAIYDFSRRELLFIDDLIAAVLSINELLSIQEVKEYFDGSFDRGIDAYFRKFEDSGFGHFTNDPELFIPVDLDYKVPFNVVNAVVEVSDSYHCEQVIRRISTMNTHSIQLRFFQHHSKDDILSVIDFAYSCEFRFIDVLVNAEYMSKEDVMLIVAHTKFFDRLAIYGSKVVVKGNRKTTFIDRLLSQGLLAKMDLGQVFVSQNFFGESLEKNPVFNKKIAIDANGSIKNELSHDRTFGNVKFDNIYDVYKSVEFRNIWQIHREKIDKCSGCVFRFCCTFGSDVVTYMADRHSLLVDCNVDEWHRK